MRTIMHVGLPKTGTTSIQAWLAENAEALLKVGVAYDPIDLPGLPNEASQLEIGFCQFERCGQLIPDDATQANYQLHIPGRQAELARQYEEVFAAAVDRARAAGAHTFALSSEHIGAWCWTTDHVRALDDWLGQFFDDRQYVFYIRRQEDWLPSLYSQHIKNGGTETMQEFLEIFGTTNFFHKARIFSEVVAPDKLILRLMDRADMKGGDLYMDFADLFGLDAGDFTTPDTQNPSLSMQTAEFMRMMNGYFRPRVDGNSRRNPLFYDVAEYLETISPNGRKLALTPQQVDEIRARNAQANEALRSKFFPDRAELFPMKPPAKIQGAYPSPQEMAMIGIQLYRATRLQKLPPLEEHDRTSVETRGKVAEAEQGAPPEA